MSLASIDSLNNYVQRGKDNFLDLAPNFEAYNDLLSTEIVKKMKTLQSEKTRPSFKIYPENEKVQVVDQKLKDMDDYLLEGIKNSKADLQIKYDELDLAIKNAESAFASMPSKQKNMVILDRNFGLNEDIYKFLHEKKNRRRNNKSCQHFLSPHSCSGRSSYNAGIPKCNPAESSGRFSWLPGRDFPDLSCTLYQRQG